MRVYLVPGSSVSSDSASAGLTLLSTHALPLEFSSPFSIEHTRFSLNGTVLHLWTWVRDSAGGVRFVSQRVNCVVAEERTVVKRFVNLNHTVVNTHV